MKTPDKTQLPSALAAQIRAKLPGKVLAPREGLQPELVIYNDKNLYCIILYQAPSPKHDEDELIQTDVGRIRHWSKQDVHNFYQELNRKHGPDIAACLLHLFSYIWRQFNNFHLGGGPGDKDRLFHAVITCRNDKSQTVEKSLKVIYEAAAVSMRKHGSEPKSYEHTIKHQALATHTLYSLDIANFYWLINPVTHGYRIGIVDNKGRLKKTPE